MEEYFNFHNMSELENMMINISVEGDKKTWELVQSVKKPLERCAKRRLYWTAIKKLKTK